MFDCFARRLHRLGISGKGEGACGLAWCLRESAPVRRRAPGALTWLLDAGRRAVCRLRHAGGRMACGALSGRLRRGQTTRRGGSGRPRGAALLTADASARDVLGMKKSAICRGRRLEKLLAAQTGERALGLCERQGVFLCRAARSGHVVAFCTQSVTQDGAIVDAQCFDGFCLRGCGAFASSVRLADGMDGFAAAPDG